MIPKCLAVGAGIITAIAVGPARSSAQAPLSFERYRDQIEPILVKDRGGHGPGLSPCVTCHTHNGTPLKLEPLKEDANGGVFWSEEQSRRNFATVSRLITPGKPDTSRLLREPLAIDAGGARFHVGGKFFESKDHPEWQIMAAWVRDASAHSEPSVADPSPPLDFGFFRDCVQRIFLNKRQGLMECVHCHDSGVRGFAQNIPDGTYWNNAQSRENFTLLKRYIDPGFPMRSRFLTHPLAADAGGDHFHGGGRRWASREDPEWQMLAAWVRGERPECLSN